MVPLKGYFLNWKISKRQMKKSVKKIASTILYVSEKFGQNPDMHRKQK